MTVLAALLLAGGIAAAVNSVAHKTTVHPPLVGTFGFASLSRIALLVVTVIWGRPESQWLGPL
ncbi:hypothetical protein [Streptomyces sp. STR69]|uniref:hypothetical protein n=1 Tax=Streptomyces sp. STR69 TaxID=1796942 RepID=UPI0021C90BD1|nr:hypothetical protein [Streptomyces sp. STR69]